jgi:hypothetical protein
MGNISSAYFVFDDDELDTIEKNISKDISPTEMNGKIGHCYKNDLYYETKIELLEDQIVQLETNYDDLFLDYSRMKIKYESLQKKIE